MPKDYNVFQMLIAALCCFYHRRSIIRVKVGALFQLGVLVSNLSVCFYTVVGYRVFLIKNTFTIHCCLREKLEQQNCLKTCSFVSLKLAVFMFRD